MKPFLIGALAAIGLMTCACSGSTPGAQPTHTVTVTATTSPAATRPSATPQAATSSAAATACQTKHLSGSVAQPQGNTAGSLGLVIVFTNMSKTACTLSGYPGVTQAAGAPVTDIGLPSTGKPSAANTPVTLPPGGFASAKLQIADAGNYPSTMCKPAKATSLKVIPPDQKTPLHISFGSTACRGNVRLLSVSSVVQGSAG